MNRIKIEDIENWQLEELSDQELEAVSGGGIQELTADSGGGGGSDGFDFTGRNNEREGPVHAGGPNISYQL